MHADMDCFFAACEVKNNPELRKKPIVIGADPKNGKGRGVVSTCSYEARKFGISSGMPISQAYKLNPKAVFLPVNFALYYEVSERIMKILRSYANKFQQISVDEAYLDITEKSGDFADAKILALKIKNEIYEKEKLTCSIGIASNKLIAKIASEFNKPDSITIIEEKNNKKFLENLDVRKLYGVGPKTEEKLKKLGIDTIGQLADFNKEKLIGIFGVYGLYLNLSANGIGDDFVAEEYERLSIGREMTFEHDIEDFDLISTAIDEIAEEIYSELKEGSYLYKTVSIKVRLHDFKTFTRAKTLNYLINDKKTIVNIAKALFQEFAGNKIRLIGIRVSNLEEFKKQMTLQNYIVPDFNY